MTEHRRRYDENGETMHERSTDADHWARLDEWANRYKIAWGFWILILGITGWVGSRIVQPLNQIPAITARQIVVISRLDYGDSVRADMQDILRILTRIQCLQLDRIERAKLNLRCSDIPEPERQGVVR